jgi:predicted O-linked N-acetylglucosamine transferase (SPINDLY family)
LACDWRRREDDKRRISAGLSIGRRLVGPLNHRAICSSEAEHFVFAQLRAKEFPAAANPLWQGETYRHNKIRIAYISTDYRDHVLSSAIVGCFEHHDKTRFETTAISLSPDDGSEMRRRVEAAFDSFIDAQAMSDAQAAKALRELETDIAIDQNGYSGNGRPGILSHCPAPVQVSYLAYPGTMGAPFIDYIIADRLLIPDENRMFYTEQVVYLPYTYLPTDNKRPIAEITPSRADAGLPETGFVFVCNNNAHKIGPEMFDIWMRLLQAVEGSVLWLKTLSPSTMINLRREANARGISPARLVFAPPVRDIGDHLARLGLANLFLDTLPYNAHATASDALWAGLPVLTCLGNSFPAGVAAGVLHAVGLHELVTKSLAEYEEQALALARDPERLAAIKAKLLRNRGTAPLFDTARFTRDLECAYTVMWERTQRGEPPQSFSIESFSTES